MEPISCMIIDDDPISSRVIKSMIEKTDSLYLEQTCARSIEALEQLHQIPVSLIFLGIEMPEMNGFELLDALEKKPKIILVSAKKDYVEEAFEKEVVDYLVKPIYNYPRFLKAVNKAIQQIHDRQPFLDTGQFFVKVGPLLHNVNLSNILWVQAYGDFIKVCTLEKTYTILGKFKTILKKLPATKFVQIHRSYVVRIDKIKNIGNDNLQIAERILPISKSFKKHLINQINTI